MAGIVSLVSLALIWGIIWANLPSKEELLAAQPPPQISAPAPAEPVLDLTIPGVPSGSQRGVPPHEGAGRALLGPSRDGSRGEEEVPHDGPAVFLNADPRARQIAEVKCDAEVQQHCPESLTVEERRSCAVQRLNQFPPACQQIVRQWIVRWKEADGYKQACSDDVIRFCQGIQPGEGRILQCLQNHEQELSDRCYRTLPKGQLLLRR